MSFSKKVSGSKKEYVLRSALNCSYEFIWKDWFCVWPELSKNCEEFKYGGREIFDCWRVEEFRFGREREFGLDWGLWEDIEIFGDRDGIKGEFEVLDVDFWLK